MSDLNQANDRIINNKLNDADYQATIQVKRVTSKMIENLASIITDPAVITRRAQVTRLTGFTMSDINYLTFQASTALTKLKTLYNTCKAEWEHSTIGTTDYLQPKVLKFRNAINQVELLGIFKTANYFLLTIYENYYATILMLL